jgi:hypothetical protein
MWPFRATRRPTFASNSDLSNDMIASLRYAAQWGARLARIFAFEGGYVMAWTSPVFEEVVLCCEINSYVSAKL